MGEVLGILLINLISAVVSILLIYLVKFLYSKFLYIEINSKKIKSNRKEFHGNFFISSLKISTVSLALFYYFKSIYNVYLPLSLLENNIKVQIIILIVFLGSLPLMITYEAFNYLRKNYY